MKVKFDRTASMFIIDVNDELGFEGVVVELPDADVAKVKAMQEAIALTQADIAVSGAPEDTAQVLAEAFIGRLP